MILVAKCTSKSNSSFIQDKFKGLKMVTNFEALLPQGILFSIKDIDAINLIKSDMLKKIIYNREIEVVKIGKRISFQGLL